MKKSNLNKYGLKRYKRVTPDKLLKRAKKLHSKILNGEFSGIKLRRAKKLHADYMWKYRNLTGATVKKSDKLAQLLLPTFLSQESVVRMDELLINRAVKLAIKKAKKTKRSTKRKVA